ncbi:SPW repeat protein [Devosia albogilva]|uniref:SPW repeat protein n=1 Tax=Devosia albogilva TaxID=429726 RepID=A0ABW5QQF3_9HYPH
MIPTRTHGIIDYIYGIALIAAPFVLGFADGSSAQWVPIIIGVATIAMSLITRYELGVIKVLPMLAHISVDAVAGLVLLASPWVFGFADRIWWPHVLFGAIAIVVPLLTARKSPIELRDRGLSPSA